MKFIKTLGAGLTLIALPTIALATDLNDITATLMTPTLIITKMMVFACYVVGAILIFAAIAQYRNHRQSPKLVPLTTPVLLLVIGIVLLLFPYFSTLAKDTASAAEKAKRDGSDQSRPSSLVQPRDEGTSTGPGNLPVDEPVEPYEPGRSGGGHWSDDY